LSPSGFEIRGGRPVLGRQPWQILAGRTVLGAVAVLHRSVPPAQAWRVPLLCIQRQQGVSTILAFACWWHCAAQLGGVVTALVFVDTAREIPADVRPRGIGGRARCGARGWPIFQPIEAPISVMARPARRRF